MDILLMCNVYIYTIFLTHAMFFESWLTFYKVGFMT
uniref:Uncharacterized protein n=1 Tax=Anguilla anguilla TaxID=7936 RepID=A0A0E9TXN1_ANGAN